MFQHVLSVSAHADDTILCVGGMLSDFLTKGTATVRDLTFFGNGSPRIIPDSHQRSMLRREHAKAMKLVGVADYTLHEYEACSADFQTKCGNLRIELEDLLRSKGKFKPTAVLTHAPWDTHQDHVAVSAEVMRVFKKHCSIFYYSFPWNDLSGPKPNVIVPISKEALAIKQRAVKLYTVQVDPKRTYTDPRVVQAVARFWGSQVGVDYAEALYVGRLIVQETL